jgi:hypothetical protein
MVSSFITSSARDNEVADALARLGPPPMKVSQSPYQEHHRGREAQCQYQGLAQENHPGLLHKIRGERGT